MAKKNKLPKHIAGVKIPKKLRKRGGQVYAFIQSPLVAHVIAAVLLTAADNISKKPKVKKAGKKAKRAAAGTADAAIGIPGDGGLIGDRGHQPSTGSPASASVAGTGPGRCLGPEALAVASAFVLARMCGY